QGVHRPGPPARPPLRPGRGMDGPEAVRPAGRAGSPYPDERRQADDGKRGRGGREAPHCRGGGPGSPLAEAGAAVVGADRSRSMTSRLGGLQMNRLPLVLLALCLALPGCWQKDCSRWRFMSAGDYWGRVHDGCCYEILETRDEYICLYVQLEEGREFYRVDRR